MSTHCRQDQPTNTYSYSTLDNTSNFGCKNLCTCKNTNERSQYDIDMLNRYSEKARISYGGIRYPIPDYSSHPERLTY